MTRKMLLVAACFAAPVLVGSVAVSQGLVSATREQGFVTSALDDLKFKAVESKTFGGPQEFEVTRETLEFLKDKVVVVKPDGSIEVQKKSK